MIGRVVDGCLLLDPESGIHTDPKQGNPKQVIAYVVGKDCDDSSLCENRSDQAGVEIDKEGVWKRGPRDTTHSELNMAVEKTLPAKAVVIPDLGIYD